MKRLFIALATLLAVAGLCVVMLVVEKRDLGYLITATEQIEEVLNAGDLAACEEKTKQFVEEFGTHTRVLPFFVRHADITHVEEVVVPLPYLLEEGDDSRFLAELMRCRTMLQRLEESDRITWENIL